MPKIPAGGRAAARQKGVGKLSKTVLPFLKGGLYQKEKGRITAESTRRRAGGSEAEMGRNSFRKLPRPFERRFISERECHRCGSQCQLQRRYTNPYNQKEDKSMEPHTNHAKPYCKHRRAWSNLRKHTQTYNGMQNHILT